MTTDGFTQQLSHSHGVSRAASFAQTGIAARSYNRDQIARELISMRAMLREFVATLSGAQAAPPLIATINPPLWEAAHVAWFAEWFCVRNAHTSADGQQRADSPSCWRESDAFLNSSTIAHDARWQLPALTKPATLDYLDRSLQLTLDTLQRTGNDDESLYRFRLAMFHEAMHLEAFAWTAQTLAWPMPTWINAFDRDDPRNTNFSANRPRFMGSRNISLGFQFDNEISSEPLNNGAMIANADLVLNRDFARFVESGDYTRAVDRPHPVYWRKLANGDWEQRRFDRWIPLAEDEPVIHVSAHEAEAYAAWIGGRLPTEAELHSLFAQSPNAWDGRVWEWTSTPFAPYDADAFTPGLYREYSEPWFDGKHRVLRGGSFATLPIMHHPHYRNFFTPERSDVFAGFRVIS
jgi:gamma-glutamyl hercynylcysteine S-oxide synthase